MTETAACTTELAAVTPWNEGPPKLNGARAFGARVSSPVFHPVPATGLRPMRFEAANLPDGLAIEADTGVLTGSVAAETEAVATITAVNESGSDSAQLRIVIGEQIALTPPLGWNSWNCWGRHIDEEKVRAAADAMVSSGLAAHGYSYVNIDDGWQGERGGPLGALQANEKFADMKALCDYVHSLGLRIGIYSTPWAKSYAGYNGGSTGPQVRIDIRNGEDRGFYFGRKPCHNEDAKQWARWGIDYLKYDWGPWRAPDVEAMADALRAAGRDIVYSLSNTAPFEGAADWARLANCWRTTGDITDSWSNVSNIAFSQDRWTPHGGPGHWNDPDMLVVGKLGWGEVRDNRLARDEQIAHITMWAILAAPMLIGCDMGQLDEFTLRLLCNDEVLAINQDPLGRQGYCVRELRCASADGANAVHECVYRRELADGSLAVALFNRTEQPITVEADWAVLGIDGPRQVRNVWANKDVGSCDGAVAMPVPPHGAQMLCLSE